MGLGRLERDRRCGRYLEQDRCRGRKVAQMPAIPNSSTRGRSQL